MPIAGIIAEYNPLHAGHVHLMEEARCLLGPDTAILCVMSGDFVQRGDFALASKRARAAAAVESGADLVLELPLPWAVSPAEAFSAGAVELLENTGVVTHLVFGSECGDAAALNRVAAALNGEAFSERVRGELTAGDTFAAARQRAVSALTSREDAALLERPNNILGVEYCKSLQRLHSRIQAVTVLRTGAAHDAESGASSSAIRTLLRRGEREAALGCMAPAMRIAYELEEGENRAPVFYETCERAVLARLRSMEPADFAALDPGREGLRNRLYQAVRGGVTVEEILTAAKTKRYPLARLRRMVLWAYLGLTEVPARVPYARPLAANAVGRSLLAAMRKKAAIPVLTKPAAVHRLPEDAIRLFELEARAADLYALAYPAPAPGGGEWRARPVML
ncbi:MAG: nucleotidyltransferase family protein [Oscillibacter sp.]|nr:nucleotidyltransferase family protein [Oscillibacter sp.]